MSKAKTVEFPPACYPLASCPECGALVLMRRFGEGPWEPKDVLPRYWEGIAELLGFAALRQGYGPGLGGDHVCPATTEPGFIIKGSL